MNPSGTQSILCSDVESPIDSYLSSLNSLKEKVLTRVIVPCQLKLNADSFFISFASRVTCNTEAFQRQTADVFSHLTELEVQLSSLEAWSGLPPECFKGTTSPNSGTLHDLDNASAEAQNIVELVQQLQSGLRSMAVKSQRPFDHQLLANDGVDFGVRDGKSSFHYANTSSTSIPGSASHPAPTTPHSLPSGGIIPQPMQSYHQHQLTQSALAQAYGQPGRHQTTPDETDSVSVMQQSSAVRYPYTPPTPFSGPVTPSGGLESELMAHCAGAGFHSSSSHAPSMRAYMANQSVAQNSPSTFPYQRVNEPMATPGYPYHPNPGGDLTPEPAIDRSMGRAEYASLGSVPRNPATAQPPPTQPQLAKHEALSLRNHPLQQSLHRAVTLVIRPTPLVVCDRRSLLHTTVVCRANYWKRFGLQPDEAGCDTVYRDEVHLKRRPRTTSVASGGGGGQAYRESYLQPKPVNLRYNPRLYSGGVLPRLEYTDEPVKMPEYRPRDVWAPHRAHFGQNDYIDILGNGDLQPLDFYTGPPWVLRARNEFQRVSARLNNPALVAWMEEFEPSRLKLEEKRLRYLFKQVNKRKNIKFLKYRDAP